MKTNISRLFPSRLRELPIFSALIIVLIMVFMIINHTPARAQGLSMTVTPTNPDCSSPDGEIEITINNGTPPICIEVTFQNTNSVLLNNCGSTTYFNLNGLLPGSYYIKIWDPLTDFITQTVYLDDYNGNWPLFPKNDLRAIAVDVEVDSRLNVVGCGFWTGFINFDYPGFDQFWDMNSNCASDVYLVKYDVCGIILWAQQVYTNAEQDNVKVNALCFDTDDNVIACGTFCGDLVFPGNNNIILQSDPNKPGSAWVAKFDEANGECLWAVQFSSSRVVQAKDACAYPDGTIFVAADFEGADVDLYDITTNVMGTLTNAQGGYFDAFLAAYDEDGNYLDAEILVTNSNDNDVAGGLCCFESFQGSSVPEIIITGVRDDDVFLGQRWYYNSGLSLISTINLGPPGGIGNNPDHVGMTVEAWEDPGNGQKMFAFAGYVIDNTASYPFLASCFSPAIAPPNPQTTLDHFEFIGFQQAFNTNISNALTVNTPTGEIFIGGIVNDDGDHPANQINFINVPASPFGDFFVDKFPTSSNGIGDIDWSVYANSGTANYGQAPFSAPYYLGLGSDRLGKTFVTGSYIDEITSGFGLNINPTSASGVYFGRVVESLTGGYIKKLPGENHLSANDWQLLLYPNPSSGKLIIHVPPQTSRLDFLSIDGRIVKVIKPSGFGSSYLTVNTGFLEAGAYILRLHAGSKVYTAKFIQQ